MHNFNDAFFTRYKNIPKYTIYIYIHIFMFPIIAIVKFPFDDPQATNKFSNSMNASPIKRFRISRHVGFFNCLGNFIRYIFL